jgi:ketosteroid isomerase-like protein
MVISMLGQKSEEKVDQRVKEFFAPYERTNSSFDVSEVSGLYADTFMFGGPNGVQVVNKEGFSRVVANMKAHFSSMGLSETRIQTVEANLLGPKYLLAKAVWRMKFQSSSSKSYVDASATYVLERRSGDALSIVLQIDNQDLASLIKEQQSAQ